MSVIATRRSADRAFIYYEGEDYVLRKSYYQTSSIFAKSEPFLTGGYSDLLAVAALAVAPPAQLLVLGGGCGSSFPLCLRHAPRLRIVSLDRDQEVSAAGRHFCTQVLGPEATAISWLVQPAEEVGASLLAAAGAIFIDLYTDDDISPLTLDERFHSRIAAESGEDQLVFINVFDALYSSATSPTRALIDLLGRCYRSFLILRRAYSSIVVCALESQERLRQRIGGALGRLDLPAGDPTEIHESIDRRTPPRAWEARFSISAQVAAAGAPPRDPDSLIARVNRDLGRLSSAETVALLKVRSAFLDF